MKSPRSVQRRAMGLCRDCPNPSSKLHCESCIQRMYERKRARVLRGTCSECTEPVAPGHSRCETCLALKRAQDRRTATEHSWRAMLARCTNPKAFGWKYYGGRGVLVCNRWRASFAAFLADMGERPDGKTLDRIDVDGNYEPGNCRWATPKEQAANRRKPRRGDWREEKK